MEISKKELDNLETTIWDLGKKLTALQNENKRLEIRLHAQDKKLNTLRERLHLVKKGIEYFINLLYNMK